MRIAITGASGNVGTALLRRLATTGHDVVGICRRTPQDAGAPYDGVQWVSADVAADHDVLREALRGCDAVVHLAWLIQPARRPEELTRVNVGGSKAVVAAALAAGVPHLVHVSSVGTYAQHPHDDSRVDESWSTAGIRGSQYSREKSAVEAHLDQVEREHPELTVARVRPALVFQRDAGSEIARYFVGALAPTRVLRRVPLPLLPLPRRLRLQLVHADDLADALVRVVEQRGRGAFNVADEPVLGGRDLGLALKAGRIVPVDRRVARAVVKATYLAHVHPVQEGWLDLALGVPLMDTDRVRTELGWRPERSSSQALRELVEGMSEHAGTGSGPLRQRRATGSRTGV
ncbi:NAD-dependent epimerase/dehydratase family protein [Kineococcus rubinsiae]|uniref:NAD-dependent epimerase/dehydratase family protein n=1 Tax=Kineococcus rubinsiae TaxID=2609562 RepID=UPI00143093DE|nr:NAD-dependent epimerase/dehydratase family protein [Kineococcus rubinsiae]NIZ89466.1 NAD-dependent epimerase/dehydratase family protein [Kineococcus rubinsiae]